MTKRTKHMRKHRLNRTGRPRKKEAERNASGRITKRWADGETEKDAMSVGIAARMRIYGVDADTAKQPYITDVLERMVLDNAIDRRQCDALKEFREAHNAYQRAIGAKPDTGTPPAPEISGGGTWEEFVASAVGRWERMKQAVERVRREQAAYGHQAQPWHALATMAIWNRHDHKLVGDLRMAANALADLKNGRRVA